MKILENSSNIDSVHLIQSIIFTLELDKIDFCVCIHKAKLNWRQINDTIEKKILNISSGLRYSNYELETIQGKNICDFVAFNNYQKLISISSKIIINKEEKHLLMMNLHTAEEIKIDNIVQIVKKLTDKRFWIVKTDRFYHIYTNEIADKNRWLEWNINFLMLDCLVSPRYIGHSLRDGFNLLRLNSTNSIKIKVPVVIYDSINNV
jgi:hypothetical protein